MGIVLKAYLLKKNVKMKLANSVARMQRSEIRGLTGNAPGLRRKRLHPGYSDVANSA